MSEPPYWIGQSVQLRAAFMGPGRAPLGVGGVAFLLRRPDGTTVAVNAEETASPGLWLGHVTADQAGVWRVRASCLTPRPAVDEGEFLVMPSTVE